VEQRILKTTAWIGIGSNLGDRKQHLKDACDLLRTRVVRISSFYETEPVDFADQPWFLNAALEIESDWTPRELLKQCQRVEAELHRERLQPKGPRTIDLDILFYDDLILNDADLVIPHPAIANRRFVLEPLAEIAPGLIHPVMKKSIADLLRDCPDRSVVRAVGAGL
jgi:2-amino-4-hydroxy-6-hydroxymethyldihydropteridine diphosphokinase